MLKRAHQCSAVTAVCIASHLSYVTPFIYEASKESADALPMSTSRAFVLYAALLYGTWVGSTLPDIDRNVKGIRHRGFTHSLWFTGLFMLLSYFVWTDGLGTQLVMSHVYQYNKIVAFLFFGMTFGIFWHQLTDYLSVQSIDPFYPVFGYVTYERIDPETKKPYTVNVSKFPRIPIYHVGKPFFGMKDDVWAIIMVIVVVIEAFLWYRH